MFWLKKAFATAIAAAVLVAAGVGVGVSVRQGPQAVAQDPPKDPPADLEKRLRELVIQQREALEQREKFDARARALDAQIDELKAKLDPKAALPALEFVIDREDPNGPVRLDELGRQGQVLTRTYFPPFRLDNINPLYIPLKRARAAGGPKVVRIRSDRVPWDEYANAVAAACHDAGYLSKEKYGKEAVAFLYAQPDKPREH